jgi:hypothetical protein
MFALNDPATILAQAPITHRLVLHVRVADLPLQAQTSHYSAAAMSTKKTYILPTSALIGSLHTVTGGPSS